MIYHIKVASQYCTARIIRIQVCIHYAALNSTCILCIYYTLYYSRILVIPEQGLTIQLSLLNYLLPVFQQIRRGNLFYPITGLESVWSSSPKSCILLKPLPPRRWTGGMDQSWQSGWALGSKETQLHSHLTALNLNLFQQKSCRQRSCRSTYSITLPVTKSCISPWIHMLICHWKRIKPIYLFLGKHCTAFLFIWSQVDLQNWIFFCSSWAEV